MRYRWFTFGSGAVLLGLGAWFFGKPTSKPLGVAPAPQVVAAPIAPVNETPNETPRKLVEVIDLARAYDPVREPETPMPGGVNTASLIEEQYAPQRIPYAVNPENEYRDLLIRIRETPLGSFLFGSTPSERIDIQPRVVQSAEDDFRDLIIQVRETQTGSFLPAVAPSVERLDVMPRDVTPELIFTPMGVPFQTGITQPIPPNAIIQNGLINFTPYELLKVMPRELSDSNRREKYPTKPEFSSAWVVEFDNDKFLYVPQQLSPNVSVLLSYPVEVLNIVPREVK